MPPGRDDFSAGFPNVSTGVLPVLPDGDASAVPRNNAATAASAAGVRALSAQAIAFYFRAPVKAFFRTRVDYLAYARSVHQAQFAALAQVAANEQNVSRLSLGMKQTWMWMRGTTPGLLTSVIQQHGWRVVPDQILPPLIANVTVGAVLYTSYLHILGKHGFYLPITRLLFKSLTKLQAISTQNLADQRSGLILRPSPVRPSQQACWPAVFRAWLQLH